MAEAVGIVDEFIYGAKSLRENTKANCKSESGPGPDFLHGEPPTPACAAFIKESRMKCANAN
jgi:hypothetical protein